MDYTCANCKNRRSWECEDYNWGYLDTKRCPNNFELDIDTLSYSEKESILNLAEMIRSNNYYE